VDVCYVRCYNALILDYLTRSRDIVQAAIDDPAFSSAVWNIAQVTTTALRNGASFFWQATAEAQLTLSTLLGRCCRGSIMIRPRCALALTTDTSVLTAIGNDYGYESLFERQILGLAVPGTFIAISTRDVRRTSCGRSERLGKSGSPSWLHGRTGGEMALRCDVCLHAPSDSTPLIQQIHIMAGHVICGLVEEDCSPPRAICLK